MPKCNFCNSDEIEKTYYLITKIENDENVSELCCCCNCSIEYKDTIFAYLAGMKRLE